MSLTLDGITLRDWQSEAIARWKQHRRRGIVEAVTGTGKTAVGLAAVADALNRGRRVLIVVPGIGLMAQWASAMSRALPSVRVGQRGGRYRESFDDVEVLIAVVNSAISANFSVPAGPTLLVADEVHRYGAAGFARILSNRFGERIGLTATLERNDDGVDEALKPYFENVLDGCDFVRAKADEIIAPVRVMTVSVPFTPQEHAEYQDLERTLQKERFTLINRFGCAEEPFGAFLADVQIMSESDDFAARGSARRYMSAFSGRKALLASGCHKLEVLAEIGEVMALGGRSMVFSETKESCHAAADTLVGRGVDARAFTSDLNDIERTEMLSAFGTGAVTALAAPRVLDEGVDVPEADLAVIMAGSMSRRQMIQRMGRIVRPKADGRAATFIVLYMQGSVEDPARGAHEEFLSHLLDVADVIVGETRTNAVNTLASWMGVTSDQVHDTQRAPRVAALRALSEGSDLHAPIREGEASALLRAVSAWNDVHLIDRTLTVLSVLTPMQLRVLATRYGLGGVPSQSVRDAACALAVDPQAIVRIEDQALARLAHPDTVDVISELVELASRRGLGPAVREPVRN